MESQSQGDVVKKVKKRKSSFISTGRKRALLMEFAKSGRIMDALKKAKVAYQTHYCWLRDDEVYAEDYAQSESCAVEGAVDEVVRRGRHGVERKVGFHQGKWGGETVTDYSDNLLMFYTKAKRPEYRDSQKMDVNVMVESIDARTQLASMTERNPDLARLIHELLPQQSDAIIDADAIEVLPDIDAGDVSDDVDGDVDSLQCEGGGTPNASADSDQ